MKRVGYLFIALALCVGLVTATAGANSASAQSTTCYESFSILERIVVSGTPVCGIGDRNRGLSVSSNGLWCLEPTYLPHRKPTATFQDRV
jgi:hypothetical protein